MMQVIFMGKKGRHRDYGCRRNIKINGEERNVSCSLRKVNRGKMMMIY